MEIYGLLTLFKYILIGAGAFGIILLIMGLSRREVELVRRAVYLIVIAIVIYVCSYFIAQKAEQQVMEFVPEYFEEDQSGYY